jgi:hypothetical protein
MIFWRKIVIFHTKYPKNFAPPSALNFLKIGKPSSGTPKVQRLENPHQARRKSKDWKPSSGTPKVQRLKNPHQARRKSKD